MNCAKCLQPLPTIKSGDFETQHGILVFFKKDISFTKTTEPYEKIVATHHPVSGSPRGTVCLKCAQELWKEADQGEPR